VGNKIVIIFREIPDDPSNCLIVRSNALSEMYHDQLMRVLESDDAQQTVNLYEVLQRRIFGDGQNMLNALHSRGLLIKMPVSSIRVSPMPNRFEELSVVNAAIRGDSTPVSPVAAAVAAVAPTDPVAAPALDVDQSKTLAESKLLQARLMEDDAKALREEAYVLDPDLKKGGRPTKEQKKTQERKAAVKAAVDGTVN